MLRLPARLPDSLVGLVPYVDRAANLIGNDLPEFGRDVFTGLSTGRPDALAPGRFDRLLVQRVEDAADDAPETA